MAALDLFEMPLSAVLAEYNRMRLEKALPPIEKWNESKTKLLDAIARLDPAEEPVKGERPIKRQPVKTETRRSNKDSTTFTLADLAREFLPGDNGPKILRAKARRHSADLEALRVGDGWTFPINHRAKVLHILKLSAEIKEAA